MKKKSILILSLVIIVLSSCTKNQRVRQFGGTENIQLKFNEILLNSTWKQDDLWILTRDTISNIVYFRESSSWGIWEGQIIIK